MRDPAVVIATLMLAIACPGCGGAESTRPSGHGSGPSSLRIDLQAGFRGDSVKARIDGNLAYASEEVTTALLTGFADSFDVELEADQGEVLLELTVGPTTHEQRLDIDRGAFAGLSIVDGGLEVIQSDDAFGYG